MNAVTALGGVLVLLGAASPARAEARVACIVVGVHGPRAALAIERSGKRLEPLPYQLLREGDRLLVEDPAGRLVARCGAHDATIRQQQSPHEIRFEGGPPALPENLRAWLVEFLHGGEDVAASGEAATSLSVRSDGEDAWPLEAPLLTSRSTRTSAARSVLALGWRGGEPPYALRLYDAKRRLVVAEARVIAEPIAKLALPRGLELGAHEVEIVDAKGRFARGEFDAVAGDAIPAPPPALAERALSGAIGDTARAAWIASASDGVYALEAFQLADAVAQTHQPAVLLLRALRRGSLPEPPPEAAE